MNPLPDCSNARAMNAVVQAAFSPSGACAAAPAAHLRRQFSNRRAAPKRHYRKHEAKVKGRGHAHGPAHYTARTVGGVRLHPLLPRCTGRDTWIGRSLGQANVGGAASAGFSSAASEGPGGAAAVVKQRTAAVVGYREVNKSASMQKLAAAPALRYSNSQPVWRLCNPSGMCPTAQSRQGRDASTRLPSARLLDPGPRAIAYSFNTHCLSMRPGT